MYSFFGSAEQVPATNTSVISAPPPHVQQKFESPMSFGGSGYNPQRSRPFGVQDFGDFRNFSDVLPTSPQPPTVPDSSFPTDVAALHSIINGLQTELKAANSTIAHLAASVNNLAASIARLQAGQELPTPTTTTVNSNRSSIAPTLMEPQTEPQPDNPCIVAPGRGAASPEVFQQVIKSNWHGRLGRTHIVYVDALPATALIELDCFLRRKLRTLYPRGGNYSAPDGDTIFAGLAALGLQLEDRHGYTDVSLPTDGSSVVNMPTAKRVRNGASMFYKQGSDSWGGYWKGFVLETMLELARYRGLFDDEGYLRME